MCGRLDQNHSAAEYIAAMHWAGLEPILGSQAAPSFNAAPGTYRPLLRVIDGQLVADDAFWGYRAGWAVGKVPITINARIEKLANRYWGQLLKTGRANRRPRPWLGVFSAESNGEVVVMSVSEGSPADKAGLQRGDVISDVRDAEVDSLADFYRKVWTIGDAGAEVPMRIVRDGRESWLRVKSADRNSFLKRPQLQ